MKVILVLVISFNARITLRAIQGELAQNYFHDGFNVVPPKCLWLSLKTILYFLSEDPNDRPSASVYVDTGGMVNLGPEQC